MNLPTDAKPVPSRPSSLDAELERQIAATDNPRRRDDLIAGLDACRDTPESQSDFSALEGDSLCEFCLTRKASPEDGGRCFRGCRS